MQKREFIAVMIFQSTPPVKAATDVRGTVFIGADISIHAAREGGDPKMINYRQVRKISIHAAREGGDYFDCFPHSWLKIFQSTPPVKAATIFITRAQ